MKSLLKKTLTELNQLNQEVLQHLVDLPWNEARAYSTPVEKETSIYRSMLLQNFDGRTLTVKGNLIGKDLYDNYVIGFASIYLDGILLDTVHHLSIYYDCLDNKYEGTYDMEELNQVLLVERESNTPYNHCQLVEVTATVYSYTDKRGQNKWSIGTARQIDYAKNKN
jgi:hypothetical protein